MATGRAVEVLPEVIESSSAAELLVLAEVLNETLNAFLKPEEGEEKRKIFGFDRLTLGVGPLSVGLGPH